MQSWEPFLSGSVLSEISYFPPAVIALNCMLWFLSVRWISSSVFGMQRPNPRLKSRKLLQCCFFPLGAFSSFCSLSSPSGIFRYLLFTLCSELIVIWERLGLIGVLRRSLLSLFIHSFTQSTTDARLGLTLCHLCKAPTKQQRCGTHRHYV